MGKRERPLNPKGQATRLLGKLPASTTLGAFRGLSSHIHIGRGSPCTLVNALHHGLVRVTGLGLQGRGFRAFRVYGLSLGLQGGL